MLVANKIALGHIDSGIAVVGHHVGRTYCADEKLRRFCWACPPKTGAQRLAIAARVRPSMLLKPALATHGEPRTGFSMGEHAEIMAREWAVPREAQDELALKSHQNLAKAYEQVSSPT